MQLPEKELSKMARMPLFDKYCAWNKMCKEVLWHQKIVRQTDLYFRQKNSILTGLLLFKVVLKIIKHCQDEGSAGELVQGVLLGLIQNNKLEITNCFPFPSTRAGEDDDEDDGKKQ